MRYAHEGGIFGPDVWNLTHIKMISELIKDGDAVFIRTKQNTGLIAIMNGETKESILLKKASFVGWASLPEALEKGQITQCHNAGDMGMSKDVVQDFFVWSHKLPFDIPVATVEKKKDPKPDPKIDCAV